MYKDGYRHTVLEIQLASRPQLGTGDHVSVGPDLVECSAASRCVESGMFCVHRNSPGLWSGPARFPRVQATHAPIGLGGIGSC